MGQGSFLQNSSLLLCNDSFNHHGNRGVPIPGIWQSVDGEGVVTTHTSAIQPTDKTEMRTSYFRGNQMLHAFTARDVAKAYNSAYNVDILDIILQYAPLSDASDIAYSLSIGTWKPVSVNQRSEFCFWPSLEQVQSDILKENLIDPPPSRYHSFQTIYSLNNCDSIALDAYYAIRNWIIDHNFTSTSVLQRDGVGNLILDRRGEPISLRGPTSFTCNAASLGIPCICSPKIS